MAKIDYAAEYAETQIKSAGKLKSLQMLHEGAGRFLRKALEDEKNKKAGIVRAQNILAQLQMSLRLEQGETAAILFYLYDYMYELLDKGDDESVRNVLSLFDHLTRSFKLIRQRRPQAEA